MSNAAASNSSKKNGSPKIKPYAAAIFLIIYFFFLYSLTSGGNKKKVEPANPARPTSSALPVVNSLRSTGGVRRWRGRSRRPAEAICSLFCPGSKKKKCATRAWRFSCHLSGFFGDTRQLPAAKFTKPIAFVFVRFLASPFLCVCVSSRVTFGGRRFCPLAG